MNAEGKRVVIVGGGFGGVRAALTLAKFNLPKIEIELISERGHFEYQPWLYRAVSGRESAGLAIPLKKIFDSCRVKIVEDEIVSADIGKKIIRGTAASYNFDFLVLALGSETSYFDIPGLKKRSFCLKTAAQAKRLHHHLLGRNERQIAVVGGGASGVELAGELAQTFPRASIDLIEAGPRLLASLPEIVSLKVKQRLESLGVKVFLNQAILRENTTELDLAELAIKTKTVIWCAGVRPHRLLSKIDGLKRDKFGRILVDRRLQARGFEDIFVIGDIASTPFTGMAQTANLEGRYVAEAIFNKISNRQVPFYRPRQPACVIPIGSGWAAAVIGAIKIFGWPAWVLRRFADWRYLRSL